MFSEFLMLFIVLHVGLWIIGVLTERPGFVMVAIVLDFLTMVASTTAIETTAILPVSNSTAEFTVKATEDPSLAIALFILLIWYAFTLFEMSMSDVGSAEENRSKKRILVPLEWMEKR